MFKELVKLTNAYRDTVIFLNPDEISLIKYKDGYYVADEYRQVTTVAMRSGNEVNVIGMPEDVVEEIKAQQKKAGKRLC